MYTLAIVLIFIVCLLLVLIVLVQESKGGGLASSFSGNNQIMGVRRTTDFLEKATWWLAGLLLFFCIFASASIDREEIQQDSVIGEQIQNAVDPSAVPNFPTSPQDVESVGGAEETPLPDGE
ncbi:MAG: preprotein translocase subunit SecG [Prolixibacteraceae bacterium]|nr:preprotein translocase subunit SecG [Prolixibacteraceae bacterium]MBN2648753.1 preprotein translocase subunit SecG [Prolixibacteraceae bacterium]